MFAVIGLALAVLLWSHQLDEEKPVRVGVGIDLPLIYGAVIDPSDLNAAEQFIEEHPGTRLRIFEMYNDARPERAAPDLQKAIDQGVRFFVMTQASSHAVPSLSLFADGRALGINVAATSLALTGKDDYLLHIIPDLRQEQTAMAQQVDRMPGGRMLVIQDTGNLAYTDPAFSVFSDALAASGRWSITRHQLLVSDLDPSSLIDLMAEPYDLLYILAGAFQIPIGNIAQLFHHFNPEAHILLTHWARATGVLEHAGDAIDRLNLLSIYPARDESPAVNDFLQRFNARFGYSPQAMAIGTRQALELFDQAFAKGHDTPVKVKAYLLSESVHETSLGPISFDPNGDFAGPYHVITDPRRELR